MLLSVIPNPSDGKIRIEYKLKQNTVNANLLIHNANGDIVFARKIAGESSYLDIDLRNFASGVYLAQINTANSRSNIVKIVIAK
jgi:hypothetical protein